MCGKTKHGYIDPAFKTIFKFIEPLFTILIHKFVGNMTKNENFTYTLYLPIYDWRKIWTEQVLYS